MVLLSEKDLKGKEVLVVDDQEFARELLRRVLMSLGMSVTTASSGEAALEILEYNVPDIILLDAYMPHMNGPDLCRHIRANASTMTVPVIFITVDCSEPNVTECLAAGASDIVSKPVHHTLFSTRLRIHLTLKHLYDEGKLADI
jgi:CheY-like chemotaxis protein